MPCSRSNWSSGSTSRPPMPMAMSPGASGSVSRSAATSAACTMLASRRSARLPPRSWAPIRVSKVHHSPEPSGDGWWVYRAPGTSKECPPSCSAADRTWSAGTYMISASGSINRRISHGQAIRSVLGRARVTHFMVSPWHWVGVVGDQEARSAGSPSLVPQPRQVARPAPQRDVVGALDDPRDKQRGTECDLLYGAGDQGSEGANGVPGGVGDCCGCSSLARSDHTHHEGLSGRHVHLGEGCSGYQECRGDREGWGECDRGEQHVAGKVGADHGGDQTEPAGQARGEHHRDGLDQRDREEQQPQGRNCHAITLGEEVGQETCGHQPAAGYVHGEQCGQSAHHCCLLYTSPSPRDGLLSR